jgi:hypothetical protein
MSMSRCILLDHAHIGDQHIPSFVDLISLSTTWSWACHVAYSSILPTLEINTSLLPRIDLLSTTRLWARNHAYSSIMPTLEINTPYFVDLIRLVLHDHEHVTMHTPRSCPHLRSTHPFLRRFDSLSTTRLWARHIAYSSIMPTLEINTYIPSSIRFS